MELALSIPAWVLWLLGAPVIVIILGLAILGFFLVTTWKSFRL